MSRQPTRSGRKTGAAAGLTGYASTVSRTTSRLAEHRVALGLVVTAIGLLLAYIAWISINGPPFQNRYELHVLIPADSPILQEGDAVRVSGRFAGFVTEVEPAPEEEALRVTTQLDPEFAPVGMDARSNVKIRSLVYLTYLEIFPGDRSNPMPEGGTIPVERSGSGVDLLEVVQLFDAEARETLRDTTVSLGHGLAGRGLELNYALADVDETAVNTRVMLDAVLEEPRALARLIAGAARTTSGLEGESPGDVAGLIRSGSAVFEVFAAQRTDLGSTIELLRPFEDEFLATAAVADPLLDEAALFTEEAAPLARGVTAALPEVNELLALSPELREETLALTAAADPALKALAPQFSALYPVVATLLPMLDSLDVVVDEIAPYADEIRLGSEGLISASRTLFPEGQTAPGSGALRFGHVAFCATARNPFPEPGAAVDNSEPCGRP